MKKSRIILVALLVMAVTCAVAFGCGNDTQDPGEPQTYTVTVTGGTADKTTAAEGETVTLTVGTAPDGSEFLHWTVNGAEIEGNTFKMPAKNVTAEAVFGKINYTVTVTGGTADKTTAQLGDKITLTVGNIPEGKVFSHWTVNGTRIDGNTFTMTAANAVVEAVYTDAEYDITVTGGTADKETAKLGETVTLTAGKAPEGQQFSHWKVNGNRIDGNTFVMTAADAVVEAVYTDAEYDITVTGGTADKETAKLGETVTLTAGKAPEGQQFSHWKVNGNRIDGNTFVMTAADAVVEAVYTDAEYDITVTGGTADKETAKLGETVTLTAGKAPEGQQFSHWKVNGNRIDGNTFVMTAADAVVEAVYTYIDYTISVTGGTADKATAHVGDTVKLTPNAPGANQAFSHWTVNGEAIEGNTFTMPAANVTANAVFVTSYTVMVEGGTADKTTAKEGEIITLTVGSVPQGKEFDYWTVNGDRIEGNTFEMPAENVTVEAVYADAEYDITVTGGTADKETAKLGETVTLTAGKAPEGQQFSHWTVNGTRIDGNTFVMTAADAVVEAVYTYIDYTISVTGGTADKATAHVGDTVKLTPNAPGANQAFSHWTVNGEAIEGNTFTMPAANVTANAVFVTSYTVMVEGGTADKTTAKEGEIITLTVGSVPQGKEFDYWTVNGDRIEGNTFEMPAENVTVNAVYADVYTISVTGGTADKETAKLGETVTLTVGEAPEGTAFSHWLVNGKRIEGNTFVMEAGNTEVEAVFVQSRKIDTPDNSENKLIYKEPGNSVALDRSGNTMFTDATDYVLVYIYDSPDAEEEVGTLKLVRDPEGDGTFNTAGTLSSSDGSLSVSLSGQPGNYFIDSNSQWDNLFKLLAHEIGYNYSDGRTFYFAMQVIAKSDPVQVDDTWIKFSDSDISAIGTEGLVKNAEVPSVMYTVTVEGGKIDGEHTSVSAGYGNTLTLTAEQPEEGFLFGGWYLADEEGNPSVDPLSMAFTYEYTVTGNAFIIAQYVEETAQEPIETPDNSQSALIRKAGTGAIEFDRSGNTMFTAATDHVVYYVYDRTDAQSGEYIGQFKMRVELGKDSYGGNAMVGWLETMDGSVSEKIVRGVEGNYYVDVIDSGRFYNFLKTILGYKYGEGKTYYFAAQAIAVPDTAYTDSEISAIGSVGIVQDATKPADDYTVTVSGGKIDGVETEVTACYGVRLTLTAEKPEDKDTFVGWKDGEGTIVSHAPNFVYTVTGSVSLTAEFIDSAEDAVKLEAPDNSNDQMIAFNVTGAVCQYDRQKDETGEPKTALGEGVAYVMYYVYTSNDDNAAVIASAKLYWNAEEEKGYFEAANGTRFDMLMGAPGNFWTTDGNAHNFFKYTVIGNYDSSGATKYYYACQAIADDSGNYVNSDIGPKGSGWAISDNVITRFLPEV